MFRVVSVFDTAQKFDRQISLCRRRSTSIINHSIAGPSNESDLAKSVNGFNRSRRQDGKSICRRLLSPKALFVIKRCRFAESEFTGFDQLPLDFLPRASEAQDS